MKKIIIAIAIMFSSPIFSAEPIFIDQYEQAVQSEEKVLIIFGTDWCGNCVSLKNEINDINLDDYVVCIVDVEQRKDLGKEYKIRSYPTSVIIKNGKEISKKIGYKKLDFKKWIDQNRSK